MACNVMVGGIAKLASRDPGDACVEEAWQTVGGKGADF